ncbi:beta strand repeat-containing protein, partial [Colwellia sp. C1TZA3]|uniref:beta strand repeat-containing protein n=1 Tax=Colwellia sp. C1TZA3 TaxID=2508879 RepID=UPI0011B9D4E3
DSVYNAAELGTDGTVSAIIGVTGSDVGDTLTYTVDGVKTVVTLDAHDIISGITIDVDPEAVVIATLSDPAGNASGEAKATAFEADTTPPTITVAAPDLTSDTTPTITGTTDVADGTEITLVVTDSANATQTFTTTASSGTYSAAVVTDLPDGAYSVVATVTDPAGNQASAIDNNSDADNIIDAIPTIIRVGDPAGFGNEVTVDEGATAVFTVQMSKASLSENTFDLSLTHGTALLGLDYAITKTVDGETTNTMVFSNGVTYNSATEKVTVPAGVSSFTVAIQTVDDSISEAAAENFTLNIGGQVGTGTINDNDGSPTIGHIGDSSGSVNNVTVLEGISAVFTVNLSNVTTRVIEYKLALTDGSAELASDYTNTMIFSNGVTYDPGTGFISVPVGVTGFTVTVPTTNNTIHEPTEAFNLSIGDVGGNNTVTGTGIITDNDAAPTISHVGDANGNINNVTVNEGDAAVFTVNMSNASSIATTFTLALMNGSANLGSDYKDHLVFSDGVTYDSATGKVSVPADVTNFTVTVPTVDGNDDYEATESFILSIGGVAATGNITDNDTGQGEPPVNNIPSGQNTLEDTELVFSTDNNNPITVVDDVTTTTLSVDSGTLTAQVFNGATITTNASGSVTISGTVAAINGALNGLVYESEVADYNGSVILTVTSTNTESAVTVGHVAINMIPVVDIKDDTVSYTPTSTGFCDNIPTTGKSLTTGHDNFTVGSTSTDTVIYGLGGNDTITTTSKGSSSNSIVTLEGNDTITTTTVDGDNVICAGDGDNKITTTITGIGGNFVGMGSGNDTMTTTNINGDNTIMAGDGNNTVTTTTTGTGNTKVTSGDGNDTITTTNVGLGTSTVLSGAGDDTVTTGAGADTVVSGAGNDTVTTTGGADIVLSGSGNDTVATGEGADIILSATGDDIIGAGAGDDIIFSGSGNDRINAATGADIINSGAGDDIIWLGNDSDKDTVIFGANATANGSDAITDFTSGTDKLNLDAMTAQTTTTAVTGDLTIIADSVYFYAMPEGAAISPATAAAALTIGATWTTGNTGDVSFFVVTDANDSAIYQYIESGLPGITADELTLMGTVDTVITTSDLVFEANVAAVAGLAAGLEGLTTAEGSPSVSSLTINVLANDNFSNDDKTITAVNGSAITEGGAAVAVANGSLVLLNNELVFTPTLVTYNGLVSFTYTVKSGGVEETANVNVQVGPVQDSIQAPVNTAPDVQYTLLATDTLVFNTANANAITVADADSLFLTTTLSVGTGGTLNVVTSGSAFITANGTGTVTIKGTATEINFALDGLSYIRADGNTSLVSMTVETTDGTLVDSDAISMVIPTNLGTETADAITVAAGDNNVIVGLGGADAITMGAGDNNIVLGGDGVDTLTIGAGLNTVYGGLGDDNFAIGANNTAYGESGNDTITAAAGNFTIYGGEGDDKITAAAGNSILSGGAGNDTILVAAGNSVITGGDGDDTITAGASVASATLAATTIDAGEGDNTINAGAGVIAKAGGGDDTINMTGASGTVDAGAGNDIISGAAGNFIVDAGEGNNKITVAAGVSTISSGSGNDQISTGAGTFTINAGDGNNVISTGATAAATTSTITTGSGSDSITTGAGVNIVNAGDGDDTITTSTGNDTIIGGSGNDILIGGTGADTFIWQDGDVGVDHIKDFSVAEGDKLDLSGILVLTTEDVLDDFLNFSSDGTNTTIDIFVEGDASDEGAPSQTIILDGVDLGSDDIEIINNLFSSDNVGTLIISDISKIDTDTKVIDIPDAAT